MAFREFFEEDNGGLSSVRLMSFISLVMALVITSGILAKFFGITTPELAAAFGVTITSITYILMIWIVGAFAPKVISKMFEQKMGIKEDPQAEGPKGDDTQPPAAQ